MNTLDMLIVDDDRGFASSLKNLLAVEGHRITLAHSGEKAIEVSRAQDFDITFMDVKLPGINGVDSFYAIRQFKPDAKIIMMTAFTVEQLLQQAMDGGAVATLRKPLDIDEVFGLVKEVSPAGIILIADDDEEFVRSIKNILVREGFEVFVAVTGEQAVDYALNNEIDILILDLRLPVMNGLEVYLKIKQHNRSVPTMVVTGYAEEEKESIELLNNMKVTGCLTKPFDTDELLTALRNMA